MRRLRIVEEGPRDGLQGFRGGILSPKTKATYINMLLESGLTDVEVGSFVSDRILQMRSTRETLRLIRKLPNSNLIALIGSASYAKEAVEYPILDTFAVFTTISESFCQKNNGCNIQKNMERIKEISHVTFSSNRRLRGYVSCVFGCPFEGYRPDFVERTINTVREMLEVGCYEVSIADTIGTATPLTIQMTLQAMAASGIDLRKIAIHLHDPHGMATRNLITAIANDISIVDGATGGIGGCPTNPDPSSNIDTRAILQVANYLDLSHDITDPTMLECAALFIRARMRENKADDL